MQIIDDQNVVSRKQSASDLQSRLKTRKLLGVGELTNNGDIYRSKVGQSSITLNTKLPTVNDVIRPAKLHDDDQLQMSISILVLI